MSSDAPACNISVEQTTTTDTAAQALGSPVVVAMTTSATTVSRWADRERRCRDTPAVRSVLRYQWAQVEHIMYTLLCAWRGLAAVMWRITRICCAVADAMLSPLDVVRDSQRGAGSRGSVVEVCVSGRVGESHVRRLCDIAPGLVDYKCDASSGKLNSQASRNILLLALLC